MAKPSFSQQVGEYLPNSYADAVKSQKFRPYQVTKSRAVPVIVKYAHLIVDDIDWGFRDNYVYHYTSIYNAKKILKDMRIQVNDARVHHFGTGVFMTKLSPCFKNKKLLWNNFLSNPKYLERLECAFAFRDNGSFFKFQDPKNPLRDLWKCNYDIDLKTKSEFYLIIRKNNV